MAARELGLPTVLLRREPPTPGGRRRRARLARGAAFPLVALIGSLLLFRHVWAHPATWSIDNGDDAVQFMWYLRWVPWAIAHGHDPLVTNYIYFPESTSLAWNTPVPVLGVLAAPLTLTLGPIFAFNALMAIAPVLTAVTARLLLRRYVAHPIAAAAGALFFAFGPYFAGHLQEHLNLSFFALLPLMLGWLDDLLRGRARHPRSTGALLGLAGAAQMEISEETLMIIGIGVGLALLGCAASRWRLTVAGLRRAAPQIGIALAVFVLLSAPLLYVQLFASTHIQVPTGAWISNLGDLVVPTNRVVNPLQLNSIIKPSQNTAENTGYLGGALLAVLAVGAGRLARDWRVRVAVFVGAVAFVLSLGPGPNRLLPWALIDKAPFLNSVLPVRLTLLMQLAAAFLVAVIVDCLLSAPLGLRRSTGLWRTAGLAAVAVALLNVLPIALPGVRVPAPQYFRDGAPGIPDGSAVLVLPMAQPLADQAMLWQAESGFRFRMPGGYALHRDQYGETVYGPNVDPLYEAANDAASFGIAIPPDVAAVQAAITYEHLNAIVVVDSAHNSAGLLELAQRATGRAPDLVEGGVSVWLLGG